MQQSTRRMFILVGSTLLTAGAMLVAACSSDSSDGSSSGTLPTVEAGKKDGTVVPPSGGDSGDLDAGQDPDCSTAPKLRDNTNGYYCAFVPKDAGVDADGGSPSYCHNNETCCSPGKDGNGNFGTTACVFDPTKSGDTACAAALATESWSTRTGNSVWECADKNNCGAGQVCCLYTAPDAGGNVNIGKSTDKTIPAACNALQAYKQGGTKCAASCAAGTEIKLCSTDDNNCGAGTTCTPFQALFRDLAYCK